MKKIAIVIFSMLQVCFLYSQDNEDKVDLLVTLKEGVRISRIGKQDGSIPITNKKALSEKLSKCISIL